MIALNDVQNTLLTAQLKLANMVDANVVAEMGGNLSIKWTSIKKATRGVNVVANRIGLGDTSSSAFQSAYACLTAFIGTFAGGAIDPNAQNPNTIIEVILPFTITLNRTDDDLIDAVPPQGVWYLPFVDDSAKPITNRVPVSVTDNGVSFDYRFDETTVPARIYGFATGDPTQAIIVKAI